MKKLSALMLTVLMVLGMCTFAAYADADISIGTYEQLVAWAKNGSDDAGKTVVLTADIVANEGDAAVFESTAPANVWTNKNFAGTFDGQGHSISGLYMSGASRQGFIAELTGTVKNLYVVNSAFISTASSNGVICRAGGGAVVENVYSDAIVVCVNTSGGIIGQLFGSVTVTSCWFDGEVTCSGSYISGIIGNQESNEATVTDCLNTGRIAGAAGSNVAGISTAVYDGKLFATRCVNAGEIYKGDLRTGASICKTITSRDGKVGEAHLVDCLNFKGYAVTQPDDRRDKAILEGEVGEFVGFGNPGSFEALTGSWVYTVHDGKKLVVPRFFGGEDAVEIAIYDVTTPVITGFEVKAEGHWGPRWTVTLDIPEGFTKDDVKLGMLIVPTKAIPSGEELLLDSAGYEYRGNVYEVANVEAVIFRDSDEGKLVATFVVTDLSEKTIRANLTVRPYAMFTVPEGSIDIYGEQESATFYTEAKLVEDAGVKAQIDALLAPIDALIGEDFPVSRDWASQGVFEELPAMLVEGTEILPAEDKGLGEYTVIVDGTEGQAVEYVALLEKLGFEKAYSNQLSEGVEIVQLTKGDLLVTVNDIGYQNKTFISAMYDQPLSPRLKNNYKSEAVAGAVTELHQIDTYWWGDSYVIKLKNGHFVIIDGAAQCELTYLLDYLETLVPENEKPVIEGWFNTHLHMDHFYLLQDFNVHPEWIDRICVEAFYFNEPSDGVKDLDKGVYNEIAGEREAISKLHTVTGETPAIYRPTIGQRYYFCDITVDIMLSQEMIPLADYTGGFNDSSTWYKFTMDGTTFVEGGDGHRADMRFLMLSYDPEELRCDLFSVLHHGSNTWKDYTAYVGEWKTLLFPYSVVIDSEANRDFIDNAVEYYVAGEGTDIFYMPYKIGAAGGHVKLPPLPEHHA